MSLYLQIEIEGEVYLLDTAIVAEIRTFDGGPIRLRGVEIPVVDLRALLNGQKAGSGCCVLVRSDGLDTIALVAERAESLIDLGDDELRHLPPIGSLGSLIDAISVRADTKTPALRLRGERIWEWCAQNATLPH